MSTREPYRTPKKAQHLHTHKRVLRVRKESLYRTPTELQHKKESYIFVKQHHTSTNTPYIQHPKRFTKDLLRASSMSQKHLSQSVHAGVYKSRSLPRRAGGSGAWALCMWKEMLQKIWDINWCEMTAWNKCVWRNFRTCLSVWNIDMRINVREDVRCTSMWNVSAKYMRLKTHQKIYDIHVRRISPWNTCIWRYIKRDLSMWNIDVEMNISGDIRNDIFMRKFYAE